MITCSGLLKQDSSPISFIFLVLRICCSAAVTSSLPQSQPLTHSIMYGCWASFIHPPDKGPACFCQVLQKQDKPLFIKEKPDPWLGPESAKDVCQKRRMDIRYQVMAKRFETRSCSLLQRPQGTAVPAFTALVLGESSGRGERAPREWGESAVRGERRESGERVGRERGGCMAFPLPWDQRQREKHKGAERCGCTRKVPRLLLWLL